MVAQIGVPSKQIGESRYDSLVRIDSSEPRQEADYTASLATAQERMQQLFACLLRIVDSPWWLTKELAGDLMMVLPENEYVSVNQIVGARGCDGI